MDGKTDRQTNWREHSIPSAFWDENIKPVDEI